MIRDMAVNAVASVLLFVMFGALALYSIFCGSFLEPEGEE